MTAGIVEIYWNARPCLERAGANLRRGGIDDKGQKLLGEVRKSLVASFPDSAVLVRFAVHAKARADDLRVMRRGVEQSNCLDGVRATIELAIQHTQCEPV
ncbi:hypothetical protein IC232_25890 [Microvirga sp. BT688]|uniref:hypothetical protein n=1 Tax=Microvirga sp. TaxID=1873136 RepID=UPI0016879DCE|nr:hypothetical protein [Microvirga sp.]MBD2750103.1 hypothetical protein [Microvirga sp.]